MINRIKCLECGTILESKFRHDFQGCGCKNATFVDGGSDYRRIGGMSLDKIMIWDEENQLFQSSENFMKF